MNWLKTWEAEQKVNGFTIASRPRSGSSSSTVEAEGQPGQTVSDDDWKVDFRNAPFRLLAIVNRLDLMRESTASVESAGGRTLRLRRRRPQRGATSVHRDFRIRAARHDTGAAAGMGAAVARAQHDRSAPFDETYKAALQVITDRFSGKIRARQTQWQRAEPVADERDSRWCCHPATCHAAGSCANSGSPTAH